MKRSIIGIDCVTTVLRPPAHVVARRGPVQITQHEFVSRTQAWTATFAQHAAQDCALYLQDGFEFICALFGAWHVGKTVWLPGDTQAATIAKLQTHVGFFVGEFSGVPCISTPKTAATQVLQPLSLDAPALRVFTSGSTGEPSAIPKTLRQLDAEIQALHTRWDEALNTATVIASVPHQHFYGLLFKVLWPLCRGAAFHSISLDYPEEICDVVAREPAVLITSPAMLRRLHDGLTWHTDHLRGVFCSGGPLPLDVAQHSAVWFAQWPQEIYGSSETGAIAWRTQDHSPAYWTALPGTTVTRDAATGQLTVCSPWLPDAQAWLTADRGEVQADGRFTLLGRADRIVKIEEKRISLDALENVLTALPEVGEARLLKLPEGRLGAVLILAAAGDAALNSQGRPALIHTLREALSTHVERVALPRRWRFVADFPRNNLGKISGAALQALFAPQDSRPQQPVIRQEQHDADCAELRLYIPADLRYFDGHFPEAPILPGVVQLDWAVKFARRFFNLPGVFQRLEKIKFQQVITPEMEVQFTLKFMPEKSLVEFAYSSAVGAHSSGRIVFGGS